MQASSNGPHQFAYPIPGAGNAQLRNDQVPLLLPPPLEKPTFEAAYKKFCINSNVQHNPQLLSIETHPIDLYSLHVHVMNEGGYMKVSAFGRVRT